jgi:hypothetical protein
MDKEKELTGRAKGGAVAAARMTPEEKADRARKGALARWGAKPLTATHKGNFNEEFGFDVECYVLSDEGKTAVISQRGMGTVLGFSEGGSRLPRFVQSERMAPFIGPELLEKFRNPVVFQWVTPGPNSNKVTVHGYDVTLLIDLCKAVLAAQAKGVLQERHKNIAAQAQIIVNASAKSGIKGLVYALAGYRPEVEEVIQAFKAFVQEEAKRYEQEFPTELYMAWHRLYSIPVPVRGKPWQFMHLTRRHVYYPLAKSSGKILELLRAFRDRDPSKKKLFQFLNEVGTRALRMHMGRVLEMAESSKTKEEYEARIVERFGGQKELELVPMPTEKVA